MLAVRAALVTAALSATALATGCGGGTDERGAVEKVTREVFDRSSSGSECRLSTPRLVKATWGTQANCEKASTIGRSGVANLSRTKVDGDTASTVLATRVGTRLVTGTIELRHLDAGWRVDGFGNDFIRSLLRGSLAAGYLQSLADKGVTGADRLFAGGEIERCVDRRLAALPAGRQQAIGQAIIGDRAGSSEVKEVQGMLVDCMAASPNGREALRLAFEAGVRAKVDSKAAGICVVDRLRTTADSKLVAAEIVARQKTGRGIGQKLTNLAAQAIGYCEKKQR